MASALDGDTITFAPHVTGTISPPEITINASVSINGHGAGYLTINGSASHRIFSIPAGKTVSLTGLTLSNGKPAAGTGTQHAGGAIRNFGNLTVSECVFAGNAAGNGLSGAEPSADGGAGGAIYSKTGTLTVVGCTFSGNKAGDGDSFLFFAKSWPSNGFGGHGGAIAGENVSIDRCIFENNSAGAGVYWVNALMSGSQGRDGGNGGAVYLTGAGACSISRSTFSNNIAGTANYTRVDPSYGTYSGGGGNGGDGGAIYQNMCPLTVSDSTIYGNKAGATGGGPRGASGGGGGIYSLGSGTSLKITSCTIAGNKTGAVLTGFDYGNYPYGNGGGIYSESGTPQVRNTLVAGNTFGQGGSGGGPDIGGTFVSLGHNLVRDAGALGHGFTNGVNGDLVGNSFLFPPSGVASGLSTLADNGGWGKTVALLAGSQALDAGDDTLTGTDQRGFPRQSGAHVDIGAVEMGSYAFAFSSSVYAMTEADGVLTVNVTRTGGTTGTVSVGYATVSGTATAEQDFGARSGTLTFAAGETQKSIQIPIYNDSLSEGMEQFTIALSSPSPGTELGSPATATVAISDAAVTSDQSWSQWLLSNNLTGPNTDPLACPANDGVSNLYKYFSGAAAASSLPDTGGYSYSPQPTVVTVGPNRYFRFAFRRRVDWAARGLVFSVETTPGLVSPAWTTQAYEVIGDPVPCDAQTEWVTIQTTQPISGAQPQSYARITVSRR